MKNLKFENVNAERQPQRSEHPGIAEVEQFYGKQPPATDTASPRYHGIWRQTDREGYKAADSKGQVCGKFNDPMRNNAWVYFVWEQQPPVTDTASLFWDDAYVDERLGREASWPQIIEAVNYSIKAALAAERERIHPSG